jgi:predicted RNase H-like HicB family nuclease
MTKITSKPVNNQPLDYYLNLPYAITLYPEAEGGYVAEIKDLQGCLTQGETLEETVNNINEAKELWLETAYNEGDLIPLPSHLIC